MKEINLQITVDETNLILEALGNMPFIKVFRLMNKIQTQANSQLEIDSNANSVPSPAQQILEPAGEE